MSGPKRWRVVVHAKDGTTSSEGFDHEATARACLYEWDRARINRAGTHVVKDDRGMPLCVIKGRDIAAVTLDYIHELIEAHEREVHGG